MLPELSEIRRRRRAAGISQKALALLARVAQPTLSKIEGEKTEAAYSTVKRLFDSLEALEGSGGGPVSDLMNARVLRVQTAETVGKAIHLMRQNDISQLPVFRRESPIGSVSERTLIERMREGQTIEELSRKRVEQVMAPSFPIVPEGASVRSASSFLEDFSAVLVSSKAGRIIGIVTKSDLLKTVKGRK